MKFENIYIDTDDDVSAVVEKILDSKSDDLVIFVPEQAKISESVLNFKLIFREAKASNKNIYINSESDEVVDLAQKAGLSVVEEKIVSKSDKKPIKKTSSFIRDISPPSKGRVKNKRFDSREKDLEEESKKVEMIFKNKLSSKNSINKESKIIDYVDEEVRERDLIKPKKKKDHGKLFKKTWKPILIFIFTIIILGGGFYLFSSAEVQISTIKTDWQDQVAILASKSLEQINFTDFKVPAEYLKLSRQVGQDFEATGVKNIEIKSQGKITIYNSFSSTSQSLVANTRFLSESGKLFRLNSNIIVPGAKIESGKIIPSSIIVSVTADQPGEDYNITASKFTIPGFKGTPKYDKFYGESTEVMKGGYIGQAKVVSASDLNRAKTSLSEIARISLEEEFNTKFPQGYKILNEAKEFVIDKFVSSAKEGDRVDNFKSDLSASLKVLAFKESEILEIFQVNAKNNIDDFEDKEIFSYDFQYGVPRVDFEKGLISFPVTGKLIFRDKMDMELIKSQLSKINESKLKQFFSNLNGVEDLKIKIRPHLFSFLPLNSNNLKIIVDGQ